MNNKAIDVYKHYKSSCGSMLLLFRVQNNYEAYFDDAITIAKILNVTLHTETAEKDTIIKVVLPSCEIWDLLEEISKNGTVCKLIQHRNSDGQYALPDIQRLKSERKMDY